MSISLRGAALTLVSSALLTSTAHAGIFDFDPAEGGYYISGFVGAAFPFDADFDGTQNPAAGAPGVVGAPAEIEADFGTPAHVGGRVGTKLPFKYWKNFQPRLELEVSTFDADVEGGSFNGGEQTFSGNQSTTLFLINNNSDWQWRDDQKIVPYFGGGIGVAKVDSEIQYFGGAATAPTFAVQGDDIGLATVSTLGLTFKANEAFDVYTEARYLKTYGIDAQRNNIATGDPIFNADVDDDPDGITLTVGARFNF